MSVPEYPQFPLLQTSRPDAYHPVAAEERGRSEFMTDLRSFGRYMLVAAGAVAAIGGGIIAGTPKQSAAFEEASAPLPTLAAEQLSRATRIVVEFVGVSRDSDPPALPAFGKHEKKLSGVTLGDGWVLTAGHGFEDRENAPGKSQVACAKVSIAGRQGNNVYFMQSQANIAHNTSYDDDVALLYIGPGNQAVIDSGQDKPKPLAVRDTPLQKNEVVYFDNWEPLPIKPAVSQERPSAWILRPYFRE